MNLCNFTATRRWNFFHRFHRLIYVILQHSSHILQIFLHSPLILHNFALYGGDTSTRALIIYSLIYFVSTSVLNWIFFGLPLTRPANTGWCDGLFIATLMFHKCPSSEPTDALPCNPRMQLEVTWLWVTGDTWGKSCPTTRLSCQIYTERLNAWFSVEWWWYLNPGNRSLN